VYIKRIDPGEFLQGPVLATATYFSRSSLRELSQSPTRKGSEY